MVKLTLKLMMLAAVLAYTGCAKSAEEPAEVEAEEQTTEVPDEAIIELLAYSSHLSIKLSEEYSQDQEAMMEEYESRMEEVASDYDLSYEELDMRAYEEKAMENPELLEEVQERIMELQEKE